MKYGQCKWYSVCPMRIFFLQGKISGQIVADYCRNKWEDCIRFQLEEKGICHPDNMLPDGKIEETLK